jgi:hypothetical protein
MYILCARPTLCALHMLDTVLSVEEWANMNSLELVKYVSIVWTDAWLV